VIERKMPAAVVAFSFVLCLLALCCACGSADQQSALHPAGPQAGKINALWWMFFWLLAIIFLLVMAAMWRTLRGSRDEKSRERLEREHMASAATEDRLTIAVGGATLLTVLILFVLLVASVTTGKATADLGKQPDLLTIEVTGNQWWWQFRYQSRDPSQVLTTANEIHIPVGRPIQIQGRSNDVIHSFWVPNLHGKRDLIPSRVTTEYIQADRPGVYRGQCAEFCGLQHAHMSFYVIAEPEEKFKEWMKAELGPAIQPQDPNLLHGQQSFMQYECVYCHQIRGTDAGGQNAPDLTHFGSRLSIAAGTLPNTPGNLSGWIVNPQSLKPGNHMATIAVKAEDLQPLSEYLESLK
jgi:cytochrome c oxidase subunit 2